MAGLRAMRVLQIAVTAMSILYLGAAIGMASASSVGDDGRRIVEKGTASGVPACTTCHGRDLRGDTAIGAPSIAGKPSDFILARLAHYSSPEGHNPLMKQVAINLTPTERTAAADYIANIRTGGVEP